MRNLQHEPVQGQCVNIRAALWLDRTSGSQPRLGQWSRHWVLDSSRPSGYIPLNSAQPAHQYMSVPPRALVFPLRFVQRASTGATGDNGPPETPDRSQGPRGPSALGNNWCLGWVPLTLLPGLLGTALRPRQHSLTQLRTGSGKPTYEEEETVSVIPPPA